MAQACVIFAPGKSAKIVNNNVNKKSRDMKNTDYSSVNGIQSIISSESSFSTLLDIIGDLGLEVISVKGEG